MLRGKLSVISRIAQFFSRNVNSFVHGNRAFRAAHRVRTRKRKLSEHVLVEGKRLSERFRNDAFKQHRHKRRRKRKVETRVAYACARKQILQYGVDENEIGRLFFALRNESRRSGYRVRFNRVYQFCKTDSEIVPAYGIQSDVNVSARKRNGYGTFVYIEHYARFNHVQNFESVERLTAYFVILVDFAENKVR